MRHYLLLIAINLIIFPAFHAGAANPVITDPYTADPATLVHDGSVYLYVGHDQAAMDRHFYDLREWLVFSSEDLVNWTAHPVPLSVKDFTWAKEHAWAAHTIEKDGKFYWYVTVFHDETHPGFAIGVAVSDRPEGPYTDARGSALITNDMTEAPFQREDPATGEMIDMDWDDIDPAAFIDDDGQAYLFWGNTTCHWVKLKDNMIEIDGPIHTIDLPGFTEAPWVHKKGDWYYLTYAYQFPEKTAYAMSRSIKGPWEYKGILNELAGNCNTNHQAILEFKGKDYFVYHNGGVQPNGGSFRRSVCIDELRYNDDGTLQRVVMTTEGVTAAINAPEMSIASPDGKITADVYLRDGELKYDVRQNGIVVMKSSRLGLETSRGIWTDGLKLGEVSESRMIKGAYELLNGKQREIRYVGRQQTIMVYNADGEDLEVEFFVADDGVAFRYNIPGAGQPVTVTREVTEFVFPEGTLGWIQPMAKAGSGWSKTNPSYEEYYVQGQPLESLDAFMLEQDAVAEAANNPAEVYGFHGWVFPALFRNPSSGKWVLLSESGVGRDDCGSRLVQDGPGYAFCIGYPMEREKVFDGSVVPTGTLPWTSPWRLMVIGDDLGTIVESTMGTDLAEPSRLQDTSWIRPGKSAWSWVVLKDDSMQYDIQKEFIEYAGRMGWEYTLLDTGWDQNLGYDKVSELVKYADSLDVGLLLWYNSSGPWNETVYSPKSRLLTKENREAEFKRISEMGIKGIKVDFFPGDGQSVMNYYHDLFESAARHKLMINTHGTTLPRGWQRTYPHLVTMESVRGMEFITFNQSNADQAPAHLAILPFTRNVFDPMDFTPMVFSELPGIKMRTLKGFELALPVLYQSGIQHLGETASGMSVEPEFVHEFLRDLPTVWEETRFIDGYPGKYAILARRGKENWYVAGINSMDKPQTWTFQLPALAEGENPILITGHPEEDRLVRHNLRPDTSGRVTTTVKPKDGFVIIY